MKGADIQRAYDEGVRAGQRIAGRRAGLEMGRRLREREQREAERAAAEDRRRRGLLSGELGSGAALSWEEITQRLRVLHRERFHFEALARDAGRC